MADREKLIKGLEYCSQGCSLNCPYFYVEECMHVIVREALPMLKEQEPKTGKWILDDEDANSWECSECGGLLQINDGTPHENDWHFCPYCGIKLEEEKVKLDD